VEQIVSWSKEVLRFGVSLLTVTPASHVTLW